MSDVSDLRAEEIKSKGFRDKLFIFLIIQGPTFFSGGDLCGSPPFLNLAGLQSLGFP